MEIDDRTDPLNNKPSHSQLSKKERKELAAWYDSMEAQPEFLPNLSKEEVEKMGDRMLRNIKDNIKEKSHIPTTPFLPASPKTVSWPSQFFKAAAVLTLGILVWYLGARLLNHPQQMVTYSTGNGQSMELTLPDGSTAVLNGNTTIQYLADWKANIPREIYLSGEAFFSVRKRPDQQKFVVHTSDKIAVEVLGTTFLVSDRKVRTQVVLQSGSVQLHFNGASAQKTIDIKPGDLVSFPKSAPLQYTHKQVDPDIYMSWLRQQLILENTSLKEICDLLEDNYGLTISTIEEGLLDLSVSGSIPLGAIDTLLADIAAAYDLAITKHHNGIMIESKAVDSD